MRSNYIRARSALDRVIAAVLLLLLSPVIGLVALTIRLKMGAPVLFRQQRIGRNGVRFHILKFRTMVPDAESLGGGYFPDQLNLVPRLGQFLRKSSLDELPQLVNILRGEMSFVGPRPALVNQYERYTQEQARRVLVPQGITGLAQVVYRNDAPWSRRILVDLEYVQRVGPLIDMWVLVRTVARVLRSDGVRSGQTSREVDDLSGRGDLK
jgi:lipopolysaccharide/colanic/teichoic acid biosynthesis glycosyltransferase